MVPRKAVRLVQALFASLGLYFIGMFMTFRTLYGMENDEPISEWGESTVRALWVVIALYPLVTVAISIILARRFGAPAVATAGATASGIVMLWLAYSMLLRLTL